SPPSALTPLREPKVKDCKDFWRSYVHRAHPAGYTSLPATTGSESPHLKQQLEQLLLTAVNTLAGSLLPEAPPASALVVERTRDSKHGDFASNVALRLAKPARRNPRELAQAIVAALPANPLIARTETAGAGFINFYLTTEAYSRELQSIHELGDTYGR